MFGKVIKRRKGKNGVDGNRHSDVQQESGVWKSDEEEEGQDGVDGNRHSDVQQENGVWQSDEEA